MTKNANIQIEKIDGESLDSIFDFLEQIFSREQHIPRKLIPLQSDEQHWWCIRKGDAIVGTVAAWNEKGEWHWGRLAIDPALRGAGLAKKLAIKSFEDLFKQEIEYIHIDARDITVTLLESLGGRIIGQTSDFYGFPITPMGLGKSDFLNSNS